MTAEVIPSPYWAESSKRRTFDYCYSYSTFCSAWLKTTNTEAQKMLKGVLLLSTIANFSLPVKNVKLLTARNTESKLAASRQ